MSTSILTGEPSHDSRFDLTPPPSMSQDMSNYELVRCDPMGDCTSMVQYKVFTTDQSSIYDVANASLEVQFSILDSSGVTGVTTASQVGLCSNGWSLFENAKLFLGEQEVLNVQKPGLVSQVRLITESSRGYIDTIGEHSHQYIDSVPTSASGVSGQAAYVAPATGATTGVSPISQYDPIQYTKGILGATGTIQAVYPNAEYDPAFRKKVDRAAAGLQKIFLNVAEIFPLLKTSVLQGTKFELELNKVSNVQECLYGTSSTTGSLVAISRVVLWMPRIKPSLAAQARFQSQIAASPQVQLEYEALTLHRQPWTNKDAGDQTWQLSSKANKPLRAYLVFQRTARSTSQAYNSLEFDLPASKTNILSQVTIRANGKQCPSFPYTPSSDYSRILSDLYKMTGKTWNDVDSSPLTKSNWPTVYPIFGFDLSAADSSAYESRSVQNLEVNWTTNASTDSNYNVFLILVSLGRAVIDHSSGLSTVKLA